MFAIAFDLSVANTAATHPKSVSAAYLEIEKTLGGFGFERVQGSLYTTQTEDLSNLFRAIQALKAQSWFPSSVNDIRAFRVEQWSDFTAFVKEP